MHSIIASIFLLLPAAIYLLSGLALGSKDKFSNVQNVVKTSSYISVIASIIGIIQLIKQPISDVNFITYNGLGLGIRIDTLSVLMYSMISIIALVVIKYSTNYLNGEKRQNDFFYRLAFTISFVQLLVLSNNLAILFIAWVGTSIGLHRLLLFYPERYKAQLAARKKFIIARFADFTLLAAFYLLYNQFGTGNLENIFSQVAQLNVNTLPLQIKLASVLLVISAGLKSVQIPFHGWLLDVMETPTPVSALLHAGLLNAGPFIIIRFAHIIDLANSASILLLVIGASSALFGAVVSTTQPTIKTALAYSSIGHMGFTLMVCGLGVYSASLLHLVAHSFYKAHSFLSSGSLIDQVKTKSATYFIRLFNTWRIILALIVSLGAYFLFAYIWGVNGNTEFQLLVISAIIFFGILSLQINSIDSKNIWRSIVYLLIGSIIVINAFFLLEHLFEFILHDQIPEIRQPNPLLINVSLAILLVYFTVALAQIFYPKIKDVWIVRHLEIHFKNGLYFNVVFDKLVHRQHAGPIK